MKIFDMHIHAWGETPDPDTLLEKMGECGVFGGMVFSNCPQALSTANGTAWIEEGRPVEQGKEAIQWMKLGYFLEN